MKKLPKYLSIIGFSMLVWGAFSVANASAAVLLQQPNNSVLGNSTSTHNVYRLGQGNLIGQISLTQPSVYFKAKGTFSNGAEVVTVNINAYTDATYTVATDVCGFNATAAVFGLGAFDEILYGNNNGAPTGDCIFDSDDYVEITFSSNIGPIQFYGVPASVTPFILYGSNYDGLTPYVVINGTNQSLNPNLINGGNPSGISTSTIQAFCNSSYATSTGFFSDIANGVTYGACTAFAFLFVPNQDTLQDFHNLASTTQSKIPFSYGYDIARVFSGLTASSSQNFPTYSIGLSAIDFSSSTAMGHIFPTSLDFLSSTTINKYLPAGMHDLLYNFAIFVIWVEVAFVLYRKIVPEKAKI